MGTQQSFAKLREILVTLYQNEDDANRVAHDAELELGNISFSSKAINKWNAILLQAQNENKISKLMAITIKEYWDHKELPVAWCNYLTTPVHETKDKPDYPMATPNVSWRWWALGVAVVSLIVLGVTIQWPQIMSSFLNGTREVPSVASSTSALQDAINERLKLINPTEPIATFDFNSENSLDDWQGNQEFANLFESGYKNSKYAVQVLSASKKDGKPNGNGGIWSTILGYTFKQGHSYMALVWCKAKAGELCKLVFSDLGDYQNSVGKIGSNAANDKWQPLIVCLTMKNDESMNVQIYNVDGDAEVLYDDLKILRVEDCL